MSFCNLRKYGHLDAACLPIGRWRGVCFCFRALYFIVTYWGHKLGINIETDMRKKMSEHLQKLSFRYFENTKTGSLMSRIANALLEIIEMAHHGPEVLFIAVMTLLGAFGLMVGINWKLALLTFVVVPFLLGFTLFFNRRMLGTFRSMMSELAEVNARVEDSIGGIRVVQAFANEGYEKKLFAVNNGRFRMTKLQSYRIMAWNTSVS